MPLGTTREDQGAWEPVTVPGFVGMRVRRARHVDSDRVRVGDVGPVRVVTSSNSPGEALRTDRDIRSDDPERYALFVQAHGISTGEQAGHSARFEPGDLGLVDLSRPMWCTYTRRRAVMVTFPKRLSPLRPRELAPLIGRRLPPTGAAGLVSTLVRELPGHLDADDGAAGARLGSAVLDLISVGVAAQLDRSPAVPGAVRRRALLVQCRGYIEQHLADVELGPTTVAAAHHISVRYLHRLFEPTGSGVAEFIRRRRLDRCRRDLLDPEQAARPVAAVGARWGLLDAAHFSRAFKREYGVPPAEYRAGYGPTQV